MGRRLIYRCAPSIVWTKDVDQTVVVNQETRYSCSFRGADAVTWDLVTMGYSYRRIVRMLSLIFSLSVEEAEGILVGALRQWRDAGIVRVSGEVDDGEPDHQYGV